MITSQESRVDFDQKVDVGETLLWWLNQRYILQCYDTKEVDKISDDYQYLYQDFPRQHLPAQK